MQQILPMTINLLPCQSGCVHFEELNMMPNKRMHPTALRAAGDAGRCAMNINLNIELPEG
jgi:hypothetical protein